MSEMQKARRAKRLLSMAEEARERARAELAQTNQRLQVVEAERQAAEHRLRQDTRGVGGSADWLLAELDHESRRRDLKSAIEDEQKVAREVVVAEHKASSAHQKHRVFERFHGNITDRIEQGARRKESLDADAFALVMWAKKQGTDGVG